MHYIKSSSNKSYAFEGKIIPALSSTTWVELDENEWNALLTNKVMKSLYDGGFLLETTEAPVTNNAVSLQNTVASLKAESAGKDAVIAEKDNEIAKLKKEFEEYKAKAIAKFNEMNAEKDKKETKKESK